MVHLSYASYSVHRITIRDRENNKTAAEAKLQYQFGAAIGTTGWQTYFSLDFGRRRPSRALHASLLHT